MHCGNRANAAICCVLLILLQACFALGLLNFRNWPRKQPFVTQKNMQSGSDQLDQGVSAISGFSEIVENYDGFILDQFGVLHDGSTSLPGAAECLQQLHSAGKKLVILSNSSRGSLFTLNRLPSYGLDDKLLIGAITSGEEACKYIIQNRLDQLKCVLFSWNGWDQESSGLQELAENGLQFSGPDEADFILAHGTQVIVTGCEDHKLLETGYMQSGDLSHYLPILEVAAKRGIPLICANPDFLVNLPDGSQGFMPGNLSRKYREMGGNSIEFGKPHKEHFQACVQLLGIEADRVVHVGDSLHHDIVGATAAGIDSVLIASGIHAADLMLETASADSPGAQAVAAGVEEKEQAAAVAGGVASWVPSTPISGKGAGLSMRVNSLVEREGLAALCQPTWVTPLFQF